MSRKLSTVLVALVASTALAVPVLSQARTVQYVYLNGELAFCADPCDVSVDTPVGHVPSPGAPFKVTPSGTHFTINIDEFAAVDGMTVFVHIWTATADLFEGCMPVRTATTITGADANLPVNVKIGTLGRQLPGDLGGCSAMAVAGVATFNGLT